MRGSLPSPELKKIITKEEVIAAYRKFVERGITNPDDLDLEDAEVKEAHGLYYKWREQEEARAQGDEELKQRVNLVETMFYVDAGFTDPDYLDEVLSDWLVQDAGNAEKQGDNPERTETRRQIAAAMKKIKALLPPKAR